MGLDATAAAWLCESSFINNISENFYVKHVSCVKNMAMFETFMLYLAVFR
jgi:hypothetical protein